MRREELAIEVRPEGPSSALAAVPAWHEQPDGEPRGSAFVLAPGSNFGKGSPWTRAVAEGLLARGFAVLSFDYAYRALFERDGIERPMDPLADLEHVHAQALAALAERAGGRRLVLAGKSLGARVATLLAAKGETCHGLVLLGYPLHPRGRGRLLSEHFAAIVQPALFLAGTRDPLCDPDLLAAELRRYGGTATLERIEGADHGFRRAGDGDALPAATLADLCARIDRWERRSWP